MKEETTKKHTKRQTFPVATLFLCQTRSVSHHALKANCKNRWQRRFGFIRENVREAFISAGAKQANRWIQEPCLSVLGRPDQKHIRNGQDAQNYT